MPQIRGWVGRGRAGGLTMLSDTGDQVVCTVGQTDGHSSPYHATSHAGVQYDKIGPQATLLMPLKSLTGSIVFLRDLTGSKTGYLYKQTSLSIQVLLLCLDSAQVWLL